jgi:hypothetical protein
MLDERHEQQDTFILSKCHHQNVRWKSWTTR